MTRAQKAMLRAAYLLGKTYGRTPQRRTVYALEDLELIARVPCSLEQPPGFWKLTPKGRAIAEEMATRRAKRRKT